MSGGVIDGEPVDAAVTNPAFIIKNADDFTVHRLGLQKPSGDGPLLFTSAQQALNTLMTASGSTETVPGNTYGAVPSTVNDGDNYQTAIFKLCRKFAALVINGGHAHSGVDGDGPQIQAPNLASVPLHGYIIQGVDLTGVTGGSTDVSTQMAGVPVSSSSTVLGAVVTPPQNKIIVRNSANDNEYVDASGNQVYARLTNSGGPSGTWTLTYFSEISNVETAYSFVGSNGVRWYFQQLYNPMNGAPVYSEFATTPSLNSTADVITATTTQQGKVQLASVAPGVIAAAGSAGTPNATVANADHTHEGLHDINGVKGSGNILPGSGISVTTVGQNITISTGGFTRQTFLAQNLPDNTAGPATIFSVPTTGLSGLKISYGIQRGTGQSRSSDFWVTWDGTTLNYSDGAGVELGSLGIVLSATVGGGNFNLQFTSTSTGTDGTMNAEVTKIPA